jgi:hypothetical protein
MAAATAPMQSNSGNNAFKVLLVSYIASAFELLTCMQDKEKPMAVRNANIMAARAVADAIRTVSSNLRKNIDC